MCACAYTYGVPYQNSEQYYHTTIFWTQLRHRVVNTIWMHPFSIHARAIPTCKTFLFHETYHTTTEQQCCCFVSIRYYSLLTNLDTNKYIYIVKINLINNTFYSILISYVSYPDNIVLGVGDTCFFIFLLVCLSTAC